MKFNKVLFPLTILIIIIAIMIQNFEAYKLKNRNKSKNKNKNKIKDSEIPYVNYLELKESENDYVLPGKIKFFILINFK